MTTVGEPRGAAPTSSPARRVVAGCFIVLMVSSGLGFYGLAVYLNAFSNEQGWPVASISLATTLYFVVGGVTGLFVARLIARRDVRIPIVAGAILGGVSLALLGQVEERWQLYVVYAVFALGFSGAGLIPVTTVVTRWYHVRRSVALSVASTGLSAGGIVLTPAAKWLIDDRGLAAATPILGVRLDRRHRAVRAVARAPRPGARSAGCPTASGCRPTWRRAVPTGHAVPRGRAHPLLHRARPSPTRSCSAPRSAASSSSSSSSRTAPTRARRRWPRPRWPGCRSIARLAGGRIVSRVPIVGFTAGAGRRAGAGPRADRVRLVDAVAIFLAIILFGATVGNLLMLQPLLIAERFGVLDYPRIFSRDQFFSMVGTAGGPLLLGWLYDNAGGYDTSYLVAAACSLTGIPRARVGRSRYRAATRDLERGRHPNVQRVVAAADGRRPDDRAVRFPDGAKTAADAAAAIGVDVGARS